MERSMGSIPRSILYVAYYMKDDHDKARATTNVNKRGAIATDLPPLGTAPFDISSIEVVFKTHRLLVGLGVRVGERVDLVGRGVVCFVGFLLGAGLGFYGSR